MMAVMGGVALALSAAAAALIVRMSSVASLGVAQEAAQRTRLLPLPPMAPDSTGLTTPYAAQLDPGLSLRPAPGSLAPDLQAQDPLPTKPAAPSLLSRPPMSAPQPKPPVSPPLEEAPLPPPRPVEFASLPNSPSGPFDRSTAVYDLTAHTVYMPDGTKLEAHSGLGDRLDDPRHVDERDRGATPPHLYELTAREDLFHGVQALRLNPVGAGGVFGRDGLLAHPYMLGPNGDSNGCVSFKDYDAFLRAFQNGEVKRLAVVASRN
jgi:hypothetical protein